MVWNDYYAVLDAVLNAGPQGEPWSADALDTAVHRDGSPRRRGPQRVGVMTPARFVPIIAHAALLLREHDRAGQSG